MDVNYLIQVLERKVIILNNAKAQAFSVGDLDSINTVDHELLTVQNTLMQLNLLASVTAAAAASNSNTADMLANAIQTSQIVAPSASDIVNGYDISTYATDPDFEQKIQNLLIGMPAFSSADDVNAYIQNAAPGSPVTGAMVIASATTYNVDEPLLVAIMQNDSQFGTQGVGATTFNPGNVGNTGTATHTYASWADGVDAVASWLNDHRASTPPVVPVAVVPIVPVATTTPDTSTTTPDTSTTDTPTTTPAVPTPDIPSPTTTPDVASTTPDTTASSTDTGTTTPDTATTTPATGDTDTADNSATSTATSTSP